MGNMLPCLVQQAGTAGGALTPAMNNPKRRLISLKFLMKAIHKLKAKKSTGPGNAAANWIDSKPSSSLSSAAAVAKEEEEHGKGGEVLGEARSKGASSGRSSNNPKGAVLRSRLHGRSGGGGGLVNKKVKGGVVRVKVVLTKEEAARLLSLTVGGGQKHTAAQIVVAELRKMEARRAAANAAAWRPALASIPEESS